MTPYVVWDTVGYIVYFAQKFVVARKVKKFMDLSKIHISIESINISLYILRLETTEQKQSLFHCQRDVYPRCDAVVIVVLMQ
jgi:hypothetical protein